MVETRDQIEQAAKNALRRGWPQFGSGVVDLVKRRYPMLSRSWLEAYVDTFVRVE